MRAQSTEALHECCVVRAQSTEALHGRCVMRARSTEALHERCVMKTQSTEVLQGDLFCRKTDWVQREASGLRIITAKASVVMIEACPFALLFSAGYVLSSGDQNSTALRMVAPTDSDGIKEYLYAVLFWWGKERRIVRESTLSCA